MSIEQPSKLAEGKCVWCGAEAAVDFKYCSQEHKALNQTWEGLTEAEKEVLVTLGVTQQEREKNKKIRKQAQNKLRQASSAASEKKKGNQVR